MRNVHKVANLIARVHPVLLFCCGVCVFFGKHKPKRNLLLFPRGRFSVRLRNADVTPIQQQITAEWKGWRRRGLSCFPSHVTLAHSASFISHTRGARCRKRVRSHSYFGGGAGACLVLGRKSAIGASDKWRNGSGCLYLTGFSCSPALLLSDLLLF